MDESDDLLDGAGLSLSGADREEVLRRANGWPLYLKYVIDSGGSWEGIPEDLERWYQPIVQRGRDACGAEVVDQVLGVLCVAREPLGAADLKEITGRPLHLVRDVLERLGPLLQATERRYTIHHDTFRTYLEQELSAGREAAFVEQIVQWSRTS